MRGRGAERGTTTLLPKDKAINDLGSVGGAVDISLPSHRQTGNDSAIRRDCVIGIGCRKMGQLCCRSERSNNHAPDEHAQSSKPSSGPLVRIFMTGLGSAGKTTIVRQLHLLTKKNRYGARHVSDERLSGYLQYVPLVR